MFEYEMVEKELSNPECKKYLNEMGEEGWEVVSFDTKLVSEFDAYGYMRYKTKIIFKRKINEDN